jgi:biopolymer transport protein ExbB/TolQ
MNYLTNVLHWISSGLLIPVVVLLLIALVATLLLVGNFFERFRKRHVLKNSLKRLSRILEHENIRELDLEQHISVESPVTAQLFKMKELKWQPVHTEKLLADFELSLENKISRTRMLIRVGPMLGLMGTLIPMGPALVGLAAGDIASMALNMRVAFSTTVVGIFIGAVGFFLNQVQQRWTSDELNHLNYFYQLSQQTPENG